MDKRINWAAFDTPFGRLVATANEAGALLSLSSARDAEARAALEGQHAPALLAEVGRQLAAYCAGELRQFDLPLAPDGTAFQQAAWQALLAIPYGETRSYLQQAKALDNAKAVRAVGHANGRNPIMLIVPCHRVIGSDGSLTGYAGGLPLKQALLAFEQTQVGHRSLSLF
ncbi:methylated-DNA--[protein]-cysteine S-methyltransferase [Chitinimonas naiadis]